jgi:hypothetical protein
VFCSMGIAGGGLFILNHFDKHAGPVTFSLLNVFKPLRFHHIWSLLEIECRNQ